MKLERLLSQDLTSLVNLGQTKVKSVISFFFECGKLSIIEFEVLVYFDEQIFVLGKLTYAYKLHHLEKTLQFKKWLDMDIESNDSNHLVITNTK